MHTMRVVSACGTSWMAAAALAQGPAFVGVGDLPGGANVSRALAVSGNGQVVVGESIAANGHNAFRWTAPGGMVSLGRLGVNDQFSTATCVSADGSAIAGHSGFAPSPYESRAFYWTPSGGMIPLGPYAGGGTADLAWGIDGAGFMVVGQAGASGGSPEAFRWPGPAGAAGLGALPGGDPSYSSAFALSADGQVIVGTAREADWSPSAFRWTAASGMVGLGHLNGGGAGFRSSRALACSTDGSVVVGDSTSVTSPQEAFRWTQAGGMAGLGGLAPGFVRSSATATSADGSRVVGSAETAAGNRAFIWTAAEGMRDLKAVLEGAGLPVQGWTLFVATGISADGRVIVGVGENPAGAVEGWVAMLGCYANCDASTAAPVLNVQDFTCFLQRYAAGESYANCDGSTQPPVLNVQDFTCFLQRYAAGCP